MRSKQAPTAVMAGQGFYDRNAQRQETAVSLGLPLLARAAEETLQELRIAA